MAVEGGGEGRRWRGRRKVEREEVIMGRKMKMGVEEVKVEREEMMVGVETR